MKNEWIGYKRGAGCCTSRSSRPFRRLALPQFQGRATQKPTPNMYMYNHRVHKAWARQGLYFFIHIPTGIYRCFASRDCFKFARLRKTLKTKRQINAFLHTMYASLSPGFRWCSNRCGKRYGCKGKANIWKGECFPAFCRGKLARMPV